MKRIILAIPRFFVKKRTIVVEIICYLFMFLFLYAALNKLIDYQKFHVELSKSTLLAKIAGGIAWGIPLAEILVAVLLFIPRFRLTGLYASFCLMFAFTGYIIIVLNFSPHVPCSCGGILNNMGWTEHLIFNIGFTLLAILGIFLYTDRKEPYGKYVMA
ncbi:MauE/DoxX family redox-associated membrane protein [Sinomicrobium sp. M5D2P9]